MASRSSSRKISFHSALVWLCLCVHLCVCAHMQVSRFVKLSDFRYCSVIFLLVFWALTGGVYLCVFLCLNMCTCVCVDWMAGWGQIQAWNHVFPFSHGCHHSPQHHPIPISAWGSTANFFHHWHCDGHIREHLSVSLEGREPELWRTEGMGNRVSY